MGAARMIEFTIPIKTVNESNGQHGHWRTKAKRRKGQRRQAYFETTSNMTQIIYGQRFRTAPMHCVVLMTRLSAGTLDGDNLCVSLKSIRDGVADAFGLPDNDPRFTWNYAQEKCKRGQYGVRITITSKGEV